MTGILTRLRSFMRRPRWEAVPDPDGVKWHVRWSRPNWRGRFAYYYLGYHSASAQEYAEYRAREFNRRRRPQPSEWEDGCP